MTSNSPAAKGLYRFGPFSFDEASGDLFKGGEKIANLQPKVAETLRTFLRKRGEVISKDELLKSVWPDVTVEESNLSRVVSELRSLIGHEWIETLPRRGFRFRVEEKPAKLRRRWLVASLATLGAAAVVAIGVGRRADSVANAALSASPQSFYVYRDAASPENRFRPTGYMGDCGDIEIREADEERPYLGQTSVRIRYAAQGKGPHACPYQPPCRWAGVYWQHPPNNFGTEAKFKDAGYNLTGFRRLKFRARAERPVRVEFTVGGIDQRFGDSLREGHRLSAKLVPEWQEFEADLGDADLKHILGGFAWSPNWTNAPGGITFWLDEIRFERD